MAATEPAPTPDAHGSLLVFSATKGDVAFTLLGPDHRRGALSFAVDDQPRAALVARNPGLFLAIERTDGFGVTLHRREPRPDRPSTWLEVTMPRWDPQSAAGLLRQLGSLPVMSHSADYVDTISERLDVMEALGVGAWPGPVQAAARVGARASVRQNPLER